MMDWLILGKTALFYSIVTIYLGLCPRIINRNKSKTAEIKTAEIEEHLHVILCLILFMILVFSSYSEECSNKAGTNAGSCASGFGVCCTCK